MCNFCRIFIHCLILTSIVSAIPLGRQKRKISFFKDIFTSSFYGNDGRTLQTPDIQAEPDCMLYIVPGYGDILSQPMETEADEEAKLNKGKKARKSHRIVSNISTKNSADTAEANLQTTELKVPETRMRDAVVPITKGRNAVEIVVEENNIPDPSISEIIQTNRRKAVSYPRRNERRRIGNGVKNLRTIRIYPEAIQQVMPERITSHGQLRFLKTVEGKYSPKLIERTGSMFRFTPRSYPEVKYREKFNTVPNPPVPRINEVIVLVDNEYQMVPVIENNYPYSGQQFIPSESGPFIGRTGKKIVPLHSKPLLLVYTDRGEVENKHLSNLNRNIHEKIASDENNTLKVLKVYNSSNITATENVTDNLYDAQIDKTISSQEDQDHSKSFIIVKEKDEINTVTPFTNDHMNESPVKSSTSIDEQTKNNVNITHLVDAIPLNNNNSNGTILDMETKNETVLFKPKAQAFSQNIYEPLKYSNSHLLSDMQDRDNLLAIFNTNSTAKKSSVVDNLSVAKTNDNAKSQNINMNVAEKESNNSQNTDFRLRDIIYNLLNILEDNNEPKTKSNTNPILSNQNIPFAHIIENLPTDENNSNIKNTTSKNSQNVINQAEFNIAPDENKIKTNVVTISPLYTDNNLKTNENAKSLNSNINVSDRVSNNSQNIDFRLRDIIFNLLNILGENNEPETNNDANPILPTQNIYYAHIIENLATDKNDSKFVTNNSLNNIAPDETKIKTNDVTTSSLSIDKNYRQAITNTPQINYTTGKVNDDKKEIIHTESTVVSSNIKLPIDNIKNDQNSSTKATDNEPTDKENNLSDSSTVNGNDKKSNDIIETTRSRGDIPEASF